MPRTLTRDVCLRKTSSGAWAVQGPADVVREGATVAVPRRRGGRVAYYVEETGRPFERDGETFVYGYPRELGKGACRICRKPALSMPWSPDTSNGPGYVCLKCAHVLTLTVTEDTYLGGWQEIGGEIVTSWHTRVLVAGDDGVEVDTFASPFRSEWDAVADDVEITGGGYRRIGEWSLIGGLWTTEVVKR